jgi:hypothetical protein
MCESNLEVKERVTEDKELFALVNAKDWVEQEGL